MNPSVNAAQPGVFSSALAFCSALDAAGAIRAKKISSLELTRYTFERIERHNPALNAFVYQLKDSALAQARQADEALARDEASGVFHGVPIQVKESFAVAGQPCTWGIRSLKDARPPQNSAAVERLLGAGAILLGATNVPVNLSDWQSYNPIYGATNNPWDLNRTPGGSSGGAAAAIAGGLGYLTVGSDIGGSIRIPSHFCGIYGHKPTQDLINQRGHQPGGVPGLAGGSTLLAVAGPMARSAKDLLAALKVLGGPEGAEAKAWTWELPPPRAQKLGDFRIGYVLDDPFAPLAPDVRAALENTLENLRRAGARLTPGWPAPAGSGRFEPAVMLETYRYMLNAFFISRSPEPVKKALRAEFERVAGPAAAEALGSLPYWQEQIMRRLEFRALWQNYFNEFDVFLSPVAFTVAFPHDHSEPQSARRIATAAGPRKYSEVLNWMFAASLSGCPATVAPVGRAESGLPVGIQIMGPIWEDATPLAFADALALEFGGYSPPPGFAS
ncbi:MAG: amidase [Acidobacteriota bacterium]|nr:amidase [Acidobacteriota bacterium]MDE3169910.1 amidase [Acidobacteriota bacterium]